jgi:hypothetical protein
VSPQFFFALGTDLRQEQKLRADVHFNDIQGHVDVAKGSEDALPFWSWEWGGGGQKRAPDDVICFIEEGSFLSQLTCSILSAGVAKLDE